MGILSPTGYKRKVLKQRNFNAPHSSTEYLWVPSTIRNILRNDIYVGNMTQGKRRKKSYKIHKVEAVPENEWITVENVHEAIVDKQTFKMVQEINKRDTRVLTNKKEVSIWAGLLKCADCRHGMNKKSSTNKQGKIYRYYICNTYRVKSNKECTKHKLKIEDLENAVLKSINLHIGLLINNQKIAEKLKETKKSNTDAKPLEKLIKERKREHQRISNIKKTLYEDWKCGDITKEEYVEYKKSYEEKLLLLEKNIYALNEEKKKFIEEEKGKNELMQEFKKYEKINTLTREITVNLIDVIYVHENGDLTIKFRCKDPFAKSVV